MKLKLYEQKTDDCWRIALCNLLKLSPRKVPHFVKKYGDDFVVETRKWLNKRGKTITYTPFCEFLDTGMKYNQNMHPQGKCIAVLETNNEDVEDGDPTQHAVLMIDGQLFEKDQRSAQNVKGFFIVYNL